MQQVPPIWSPIQSESCLREIKSTNPTESEKLRLLEIWECDSCAISDSVIIEVKALFIILELRK